MAEKAGRGVERLVGDGIMCEGGGGGGGGGRAGKRLVAQFQRVEERGIELDSKAAELGAAGIEACGGLVLAAAT